MPLPVARVSMLPLPPINVGVSNATLWLEAGGRGIDTTHEREAVQDDHSVRDAMAALPRLGIARSEVHVTSKVKCLPSSFNAPKNAVPARDARADALASLELSGAQYIDLLLLWFPCKTLAQTVATYQQLEPLVSQGRVRALGVANFNASLLEALVARVSVRPVVNQCGLSVAGHRSDQWGSSLATARRCRELGVTYAAYSPLGRTTRVSNVLRLPAVRAAAEAHGVSPAQVALRWLVQQGIAVVTATRSAAHMAEALAVPRFALAREEMAALEAEPDACGQREGNP